MYRLVDQSIPKQILLSLAGFGCRKWLFFEILIRYINTIRLGNNRKIYDSFYPKWNEILFIGIVLLVKNIPIFFTFFPDKVSSQNAT